MKTSWLIAAALLLSAGVAAASEWTQYEAKAYGFSMLIPVGAAVRERESAGGWGGMYASFEGVKVYGLARLGTKESDTDIERFAVQVIGIPASQWTMIDAGANQLASILAFAPSFGERDFRECPERDHLFLTDELVAKPPEL